MPSHRARDSRFGGYCAAPAGNDAKRLINLTYVSESRILPPAVAVEMVAILACASERNRRDEITGALLFTGSCFVQTLEGTAAEVDAVMMSIARDPRHAALAVVDRHEVAARIFPQWSLTYDGPSMFVSSAVARCLADFHAGVPGDVARLLKMMVEFGAAAPLSPPR